MDEMIEQWKVHLTWLTMFDEVFLEASTRNQLNYSYDALY